MPENVPIWKQAALIIVATAEIRAGVSDTKVHPKWCCKAEAAQQPVEPFPNRMSHRFGTTERVF